MQISAARDIKSTTLIVAVAVPLLSSVETLCGWSPNASAAATSVSLGDDVYARRVLADCDVGVREVPAAFRRSAWLVLLTEETNLSRSISPRIRPSRH